MSYSGSLKRFPFPSNSEFCHPLPNMSVLGLDPKLYSNPSFSYRFDKEIPGKSPDLAFKILELSGIFSTFIVCCKTVDAVLVYRYLGSSLAVVFSRIRRQMISILISVTAILDRMGA